MPFHIVLHYFMEENIVFFLLTLHTTYLTAKVIKYASGLKFTFKKYYEMLKIIKN